VKNKSGFTLIELVMTIVLTGILSVGLYEAIMLGVNDYIINEHYLHSNNSMTDLCYIRTEKKFGKCGYAIVGHNPLLRVVLPVICFHQSGDRRQCTYCQGKLIGTDCNLRSERSRL